MAATCLALGSWPSRAARPQPGDDLAPRYRTWLEEVEPLLLEEERQAFLSLTRDHRRDRFIEEFWLARDPFPETARNELREVSSSRAREARERFSRLRGERARMYLLAGPPRQILRPTCSELPPTLEVWLYSGAPGYSRQFAAVFVPGSGGGPFRLWTPGEGVHTLLGGGPGIHGAGDAVESLERRCLEEPELRHVLEVAVDWSYLLEVVSPVPRPDPEWVSAFAARSTTVPAGAGRFAARVAVDYPGRHQSRTIVQLLVAIPGTELTSPAAGHHRLVVDGEVLRRGELFDQFRYRFDLPATTLPGEEVPLVMQRYLRPGLYELVLKVEESESGRCFRREIPLEVPRGGGPAAPLMAADATGPAPSREAASNLLAEAARVIPEGRHTLTLQPPPDGLHTGRLRVTAATGGGDVARVRFFLDGRPVLSKTTPPYSVELDLGRAPRTHAVAAASEDGEGRVLARDEIQVNGGPHRFAVRLVSPRPGATYRRSLRVQAEVDLPRGEALERVEIHLDESLVATLYQEPFVQPVLLPADGGATYVRAVAYLRDGYSAEDLVFVNAPGHLDQVQVRMVELYASVLDRRGRLVAGLGASDFTVLEDGTEQRLHRFERVRDRPVHAGILLDTSISMAEELEVAEKAALRFFREIITAADRAAVITFADEPRLTVPFTSRSEVLAGGLAGMQAEGETALYDSLVFSLYYFSGIRGKRVLILLSDGADSASVYSFDEALDYARQAGVSIYTIGLRVGMREMEIRHALRRLAAETGGRAFFIEGARELERIYDQIREEIRHQYLLAYQSARGGDEGFREVEVRLQDPALEARTIRGYHP